jgi:glutaredoxin-related protein
MVISDFTKMPRIHKRKEDARKYGYDEQSMQNALVEIKENGMSVKKAAFLYRLNRTTLMNHLKSYHTGKIGRPTLLTVDEETLLVHAIKKLGDR